MVCATITSDRGQHESAIPDRDEGNRPSLGGQQFEESCSQSSLVVAKTRPHFLPSSWSSEDTSAQSSQCVPLHSLDPYRKPALHFLLLLSNYPALEYRTTQHLIRTP